MATAVCLPTNEGTSLNKFNEIKQTNIGNSNESTNKPATAAELNAEHVSYFIAGNTDASPIAGNSTKIYAVNTEIPSNMLPTALNPINGNSENPYENRCNGYTKYYTGTNLSRPLDEKIEYLVKIQSNCDAYSYSKRTVLNDNVSDGSQINILAQLYQSINNEISNRKSTIETIKTNYLKGQEIKSDDINNNLLKNKLKRLIAEKSSIYHYDTINNELSAGKGNYYKIGTFSKQGEIIDDNDYNIIRNNVKAVMEDCICYADCNSYYVCYCYGNCNYY